ncbi:nicotinamide N-methyltransferase [Strigops habroptila]|uniref:Nicotinamide N-methyltransferase n=1 Tax=Strigops habroptila TaxID=2489341 RepID=A0A672V725_STRHB|nr:nicotinamide N-methyltransferase [Strigops habroptila]
MECGRGPCSGAGACPEWRLQEGGENRKYTGAAQRAAGGASADLAPGRMDAPAAFTDAEFYQRSFDPQEYLREFCSLSNAQGQPNTLLTQSLRSLSKMFSLDGLSGHTLIDVGCGPTIYQLLSACERFQEIIALDYTDRNRQELEKWLKNEPGAFDWSPVVKYVCELEGDREKWAEKEEKLRKKVKQVLKCDVTKANPTAPVSLPPADCIVSTLCLEAACKDLATFRSALRNISTLVKPGGHLVMVTVLQETFYAFNKQVFSCLCLERSMVEEAVEGAGFDVKVSEVQPYLPGDARTDCKAVLNLVARRHAPSTA